MRSATSRARVSRARSRPRPGLRAAASCGGAALDRLLAGAHRERRHQPALQGQDAAGRRSSPRATASACPGASSPADCSSTTARSSLARTTACCSVRRSPRRDPRAARSGGRALRCADQPHGLVRPEPVSARRSRSRLVAGRACGDEHLRLAVLELEVAQLAALGCPAVAAHGSARRRWRPRGCATGERVAAARGGRRRSRSTGRPCRCPARSRTPRCASSCASAER